MMNTKPLFKKIARTRKSLMAEIENLNYLRKQGIPVPPVLTAIHKGRILITERVGDPNPYPSKDDIELLANLVFRLHSIKSSLFGRGFYTPFPICYPISEVTGGEYVSHALKRITTMCRFHLRIAIEKEVCSNKETRELSTKLNDFLKRIRDSQDMRQYTGPYSLLHGDLKLRNVVFHDRKPYIIDVEWAHYGDPAYELCNFLFKPPTRPYTFPPQFRSSFVKKYLDMRTPRRNIPGLVRRINLWAPVQVISKICLLFRITDDRGRRQDDIIHQYSTYLTQVEDREWDIRV